jgi:hypothetical protein
LVKFAKYKPYPDENDLSMVNAYFFVNQTRDPDPIPQKENEKKNNHEVTQEDTTKNV